MYPHSIGTGTAESTRSPQTASQTAGSGQGATHTASGPPTPRRTSTAGMRRAESHADARNRCGRKSPTRSRALPRRTSTTASAAPSPAASERKDVGGVPTVCASNRRARTPRRPALCPKPQTGSGFSDDVPGTLKFRIQKEKAGSQQPRPAQSAAAPSAPAEVFPRGELQWSYATKWDFRPIARALIGL